MIRLAVFDLDGTLAPYDGFTTPENAAKLKTIEQKGVKICLCSGKPVFYGCAFARQLALDDPVLVGENGSEIQFGIHLPPRFFYHVPYSDTAKQSLAFFKKAIQTEIPDMWFQPNQTEVSPFPKCAEEFEIIERIIENNAQHIQDIHIFQYFDCFDFIPANINKGAALKILSKKLDISPEEMISVGDSHNDFSMFDYTSKSIGIGLKQPHPKAKNVSTLDEALEEILEIIDS